MLFSPCNSLKTSFCDEFSEQNDVLHLHFVVLGIYKTFGKDKLSEKLKVKSPLLSVAGAYSRVDPQEAHSKV